VKLGWSGPVTHEVIDELIGWVGLGWERWDETIRYSNSMIWSRTGHDKWQVQHVLATSMAFWINLMSSDAVQHLSTMARQSFFWCFCVCLAMEDLTDSTAQGETWCLAVIDFKKEMCEAWISSVLQCFLRDQWETSPKDGRWKNLLNGFSTDQAGHVPFLAGKRKDYQRMCAGLLESTLGSHINWSVQGRFFLKSILVLLDQGSLNLRPELSLGNSPIQNLIVFVACTTSMSLSHWCWPYLPSPEIKYQLVDETG